MASLRIVSSVFPTLAGTAHGPQVPAMNKIPGTDLRISNLGFGGNVLGWTADRDTSFALLDRFIEAGGNFIDTADMYSQWAPGHTGGESERMIGAWLKERGRPDGLVIATKVGKGTERPGLSKSNILAACDESLERLGVDRIDLYYAHEDDASVPMEETLGAFQGLIDAGKVGAVAASNFEAERLQKALELGEESGLARYVAVQPEYSLLHRDEVEGALGEVCKRHDLPVIPYWALAAGYLTGKYRKGKVDSPRAEGMNRFSEMPESEPVLDALESIAKARGVTMAAIALAWCRANPLVPSTLASGRNIAQLEQVLVAMKIDLDEGEQAQLRRALER